MRHAYGHYRNSSFIVDVAMGQTPRSTERISSYFKTAGDIHACLQIQNLHILKNIHPYQQIIRNKVEIDYSQVGLELYERISESLQLCYRPSNCYLKYSTSGNDFLTIVFLSICVLPLFNTLVDREIIFAI